MWNKQHILFSLFSLSSRPEAAGIYKLHARLPICPPACPKPALLCYKRKQNKMSVTALSL